MHAFKQQIHGVRKSLPSVSHLQNKHRKKKEMKKKSLNFASSFISTHPPTTSSSFQEILLFASSLCLPYQLPLSLISYP
jgi:hypothetical protein